MKVRSKSVSVEMYPPDARPIKWLKKNETLPGGATAAYMADFMLRLDQTKALKEDEELKVKGFICGVTLCKSRSNASGHYIPVVFDQHRGADNVLTNYLMLKSNKLIGGTGRGFFIKGMEDVKFLQADLRDVYESNPEFQAHFDSLVAGELGRFIKKIHATASSSAEEIIDVDSEAEPTKDDVMNMSLKELKVAAKKFGIDVRRDLWKGKLDYIRDSIAGALFDEKEEEDERTPTRDDVMNMSLKELKVLAEELMLKVDPGFWDEKLPDIRDGIAGALFDETDEETG